MNHADLIEQLGGGRKVSRLLAANRAAPDVGEDAVYVWKKKASIPSDYWSAMVSIAAVQGIKVTLAELASASPRRKQRTRATAA